jgi:hypothetical protein
MSDHSSIVYPTFFCILHLGDFLGNHPSSNAKNLIKVIFQPKLKCKKLNQSDFPTQTQMQKTQSK